MNHRDTEGKEDFKLDLLVSLCSPYLRGEILNRTWTLFSSLLVPVRAPDMNLFDCPHRVRDPMLNAETNRYRQVTDSAKRPLPGTICHYPYLGLLTPTMKCSGWGRKSQKRTWLEQGEAGICFLKGHRPALSGQTGLLKLGAGCRGARKEGIPMHD